LEAPNLAWRRVPLRRLLGRWFRCRVVLANDVDAGTYGEYRFGSGPPGGVNRFAHRRGRPRRGQGNKGGAGDGPMNLRWKLAGECARPLQVCR
ncbi:MAG: ROK family protein, partial [Verrucomicrobia bacterium]|nr:ROK family protein [Verrucomicrobiota bacterium]